MTDTRMPFRHWTPAEIEALEYDAKVTALLVRAYILVQEYGRGSKAGRADYLVSMNADKLVPLQQAVDALLKHAETARHWNPASPRRENNGEAELAREATRLATLIDEKRASGTVVLSRRDAADVQIALENASRVHEVLADDNTDDGPDFSKPLPEDATPHEPEWEG